MRNPNGFGCVYKAAGNRRKPYIVRITTGWDEETGKQLFKFLGSFSTSTEARNVLCEYNANPYDIDTVKTTFAELYEKWSMEKYPKLSQSMILSYKNAYRACKPIHDVQFTLLRKHQLQMLIDDSNKTYSGKERMKMLISQIFQFAIEYLLLKMK